MAAGTAHTAADALELGEALYAHDDLGSALRAWEDDQLEMGHRLVDQAKHHGDRYMGRL